MESKHKKGNQDPNFRPLKSFRYNPHLHPPVANNKQLVLAKNLSRSYGIQESSILRLIMYVDIALHWVINRDIGNFYNDLNEISDFEKEPFSIEKLTFSGPGETPGTHCSFEITNPYLIDRVYNSLIDLLNFQQIIKNKESDQKKASKSVIRKVANELYRELTAEEKITGSKPLYIIGYIFSIYGVGFKDNEPIMTEKEFNAVKKTIKRKDVSSDGSYLKYLSGAVKAYIEI